MQSLRLTSVRRLCLAVTASSFRPQPNLLLAPLVYHRQPFTSPSIRWYSDTTQSHLQTAQESREEEASRAEETERVSANTLFVGNIPFSTTQLELREIFSAYGPLRAVRLGKGDGYKSMGYAHIEFVSNQDVVEAIKKHETCPMEIEGRAVRLDFERRRKPKSRPPPPRVVRGDCEPSPTLFVGNLPYAATTKDVFETLEHLGKVVDVRIGRNWKGDSKGFAHVDFANTAEAEEVIKYNQHSSIQVMDRRISLDRANPPGAHTNPSPRLHFAGWKQSSRELRSHFGPLSKKIVDLCFLEGPDPDAPSAAGFIEFSDFKTAKEALARFNAPDLTLVYSRPKKDSGQESGRRGDETSTGFGMRFQANRGQGDESY